ncbi:PREDICTED: uncharacterized protein LOC109583430 [Amphimedon queenslandica]|uniref:Protein kinase domain-containing protein n=2 Tax=Amphimedon queenslandica TaxID=400682 RepID=A0AAN0JC65_AMPQE|nr:PREDICTED: uncharacterized protein LOC109583430 [Amphimedon queenslandica]|eukprot:XP_019854336.1 PREDICTED: uncharacterized protein LOC109583430 [Amphimedon queenslandica]
MRDRPRDKADMSTLEKSEERSLGIGDLAEILDLLKKYGYSGIDFYNFGLRLGLLPRTLDVIAKNNSGDLSSCLRESLKAWLEQADNVASNGGPTYFTLIRGLKKTEQNAVADGIDREKHPSCDILARYKSDQSVQELLPKIALFLHKEGIIKEMMLPATAQALMNAVRESVCADHSNILKFAAILQKFVSTVSVGYTIDNEYKNIYEGDNMLVLTEGDSELAIYMPQSFNAEFIDMRIKFGQTFRKVLKILKTCPSAVEDLRELLIFLYSDFKARLTQCHNVSCILELIHEKCSLINVSLLESIMNELEVMEEAVTVISEYKASIETFLQSVSLRLSLNEKFSSLPSLRCETATIYVGRNVDDCTLNDIMELVSLAADRLSKRVTLVVVREGNSFTITFSFPAFLSESLIATALNNIDSLIERGVKRLTIGYGVVYEAANDSDGSSLEKYISSVYSNDGTLQQLLVSQNILLLNSQEELTRIQKKGIQEKQVSESEGGIIQAQAFPDEQWVIDKDEVTLTKKELGRGSFSVVTVGIFRGLRVAVKSLYDDVISDKNIVLFTREMSIASRIRHPNLVQFIGATKVGSPLIVTELMSTVGNAAYASPEARDPDQQSPAMDVYSYSVLLLEMTIARLPATTLSERDRQVQTASTAWPAMKSIIEDGIAVDPRARPAISIIMNKLKNICGIFKIPDDY